MTACAFTAAQPAPAASVATTPVVFVDQAPELRLTVQSLVARGPLDERRVRLLAPEAVDDPVLAERWLHRRAVVAVPRRLNDETLRWSVLAHGRIDQLERTRAEGVHQHRLVLDDDWTDTLARPAATVWWANHDNVLLGLDRGAMRPGPDGNRSAQRFTIAGESVHVVARDGGRWTVGSALATLAAFGRVRLSLTLLERELHDAPLLTEVDLSAPLGDALRRVIEPYGLVVRREMWRDGHTVVERRHVRAAHHGRPVKVRWGERADSLADALRIDHAAPADAAQRWVAEAAGWRIESTFELVAGWDPALEGASDEAYERSASSDFAAYANVYRHWVLNEDGRFSREPYGRDAFDLAAFFGDAHVRPQPVVLGPCLTRDDAGHARPPLVEVSTDGGQSWSQYTGRAVIGADRAAVYLDDDTLPGAFFDAAKLGDARVRVTATLQSPEPVWWTRWRGNAFAGERPPRVLRVDNGFAFRRVDAQSIHHEAVASGDLDANERDDRDALDAWLVRRMAEAAQRASGALDGRGRVDLAGTWTELHVGDRLLDAGGARQTATGAAAIAAQRGAVVDALEIRFGVTAHAGPRTIVQVRF